MQSLVCIVPIYPSYLKFTFCYWIFALDRVSILTIQAVRISCHPHLSRSSLWNAFRVFSSCPLSAQLIGFPLDLELIMRCQRPDERKRRSEDYTGLYRET